MKNKLISIFVALLLIMPCCGSNFPIVRLQTNFGDILIELNQDAAPVTVDNFLRYVGLDFYDGLIFHRITDIYDNLYVIQGGAFDIHFQSRDPCEPIISESNNGLSNIRGTIAMATMPGDPNSATSQFYINYEDNLRLNYRDANDVGYCVFGTVISDMNVIDSIAQVFTVDNVPTPQGTRKDVPVDPIIIYRAELLGDLDENDQVNLKDYSSLVNGWRMNGNSDAAELAAADPTAGQWFGYSVAVSNNLAIIGAPAEVPYTNSAGCAYIFECNDGIWTQTAKLVPGDSSAGDLFGYAVDISSDYRSAIVSAPGYNQYTGCAYIFECNNGNWTQLAKLVASDAAAGDWFGNSVSTNGNYIVIAALNDDDRGNNSGSAYIFGQDVGTWSQRDKITASDGAAGDKFGVSVSACGDYIVVGAWLNDEKAADAGAAYVFIMDYSYWFELQKLTASDAQAWDKFGYSVAIHRQYVVAGAIGDDDNGSSSGSAYMFFKGVDGYWSQQAKLTAPDGQALDKFGCSVSVRDPYAVIGAYWHDDAATDAGAAYLFKRNGTAWTLSTELNTPNPAPEDYFGLSVSVDNNYVLAGAYGHDQSADNAGAAYMYRLCPETDLNGDCVVDYADLALLAENWLVKIE